MRSSGVDALQCLRILGPPENSNSSIRAGAAPSSKNLAGGFRRLEAEFPVICFVSSSCCSRRRRATARTLRRQTSFKAGYHIASSSFVHFR